MQNNEPNKRKHQQQQQQNQKDLRNYQYTTPNPYSSSQYVQPPIQRTFPYPVQQNVPSYIGGSTGYGQQIQKPQPPQQNPYYNQYSNPNPYQTNYKPNPYSEPPKEYSSSNPYSTYSQVKPYSRSYPEEVPYKSSPMITTQVIFL
jgi:hypothetical protein